MTEQTYKLLITKSGGEKCSEEYFIGKSVAEILFNKSFAEPYAINGLIRYMEDATAEYKRLAIMQGDEYLLGEVKSEDIPGFTEL